MRATTAWLLAGLAILLAASGQVVSGASDPLPPQPVGVTATHRDGQTFLTWQERPDLAGERYRIYRAAAPITAATLPDATLLREAPEGSAIFFANRYADYASPPQWHVRYAERYVIEALGPQLPEGAGLLVWTLAPTDFAGHAGVSAQPGKAAASTTFNLPPSALASRSSHDLLSYYYAITTVANGVENTADFSAANRAGPVGEQLGTPHPVRIAVTPTGWHVFIQYRDLRRWNSTFHAPNPLNNYYGLQPTTPGVPGALQYAYDYAVYVPDAARCGGSLPATLPVYLTLHAWGADHYAPATGARGAWCAYIVAPVDQSETWWFGFARDHDYRTAGGPRAGDAIANYTEQRVLDFIGFLLEWSAGEPGARPPADPNRIYVDGHSMGGGGALAMALRYPAVFAAANASKPVTDHRTSGWTFSTAARWGAISLNLPVEIDAPNGWGDHLGSFTGMGVWDWQNLQADLGRHAKEEITPLNLDFGINDTAVPWTTQGAPFFAPLEASHQPWAARVDENGHNWGAYGGLGPNYARDAQGIPFDGLTAVRDESVSGFSAVSADPPLPPTAAGTFHHTLFWSSSWQPWDGAPVDTPSQWQISIRPAVPAPAVILNGSTVQPILPMLISEGAPSATPSSISHLGEPQLARSSIVSSVTPRRLQSFRVTPGSAYFWETWSVATGELLGSGATAAAPDGTLTVPLVPFPPAGVRLDAFPAPLPVTLASFNATAVAMGVQLHWETSSERAEAVAFNILRAADIDGPYARVNAAPIPASGQPARYSFIDNPAGGPVFYRLEDVDSAGAARTHGPLRVNAPATIRLPYIAGGHQP